MKPVAEWMNAGSELNSDRDYQAVPAQYVASSGLAGSNPARFQPKHFENRSLLSDCERCWETPCGCDLLTDDDFDLLAHSAEGI